MNFTVNKKVLVIGGTGNISISIVQRLLECGYETSVFNRGTQQVVLPDAVHAIRGNRYDRAEFEAVMRKQNFDAVIDMMCLDAEDALSDLRAFPEVGQLIFCSTVCAIGIQSDYLPVDETHPLRPVTKYGKNKAAAEAVFLEEFYRTDYPVTIFRPSVTYGRFPTTIRQICWDSSWIDRIRKGKPIVVLGEGMTLCQFLHVDDAALGFVGAIDNTRCIGQIYHLVRNDVFTWREYHQAAMRVIGREVDLISAPMSLLEKSEIPGFEICEEIFSHHTYYCGKKVARDIPDFKPSISLEEGLRKTFDYLDENRLIPNCEEAVWEDNIISKLKALI
jgi:nucleoside-diphosphate-sugar epimerase